MDTQNAIVTGQQIASVEDTRVVLLVLMDDEIIHDDEHQECDDPTCPCHANVVEAG